MTKTALARHTLEYKQEAVRHPARSLMPAQPGKTARRLDQRVADSPRHS